MSAASTRTARRAGRGAGADRGRTLRPPARPHTAHASRRLRRVPRTRGAPRPRARATTTSARAIPAPRPSRRESSSVRRDAASYTRSCSLAAASHVSAARARPVPSNAAARRAGSSSSRLHASASAWCVAGRHDLAEAEVAHGLAERAHVGDDDGPSVPDRGGEHARRVGASVRHDDHRRVVHERRRPRPPGGSRAATRSARRRRARAPAAGAARPDRADRRRPRAARQGSPRGRGRARRCPCTRGGGRRRAASMPVGGVGSSRAADSNTACGMYSMRSRARPSDASSSTPRREWTITRSTAS